MCKELQLPVDSSVSIEGEPSVRAFLGALSEGRDMMTDARLEALLEAQGLALQVCACQLAMAWHQLGRVS